MFERFRPVLIALRDAPWLHRGRVRAWGTLLLAANLLTALGLILLSRHGLGPSGKPLGTDFVSFWTASQLAQAGDAAAAYHPTLHEVAQRRLFPNVTFGYEAFFYPPTFLLLCLPLALLPYLAALLVWLAVGLIAFLTALWRILPDRLALFAFPALFINAGNGQNGFITGACFAWASVLAETRPFCAGAVLGLLVIKPHLLLAAPIVLLAALRWRIIVGALGSSLMLMALATLLLGTGPWHGFFADSTLARATMEQGLVPFWKMQSVFAFARLLGGGVGPAYALQALVAFSTILAVGWTAGSRPGPAAELALIAAAAPLCTPYLFDYDLCCLAIPIAWVTALALKTGWQPWEKLVLLTAYILPFIGRPVAMASHVSVAPVILLALLVCVMRRAHAGRRKAAAPAKWVGQPDFPTAPREGEPSPAADRLIEA